MYKQVRIKVPSTPNFILSDELKQPIPIGDFTDQELRAIGEQWTADLIKKARARRGLKQESPEDEEESE